MTPIPILSSNIFQKDEIGKVRTVQEDSLINDDTPNGHLFVVCDGMGGHIGGAEASSIAVKSIFEFLNKEKYDNLQQALNDALRFANMQILGKVNEYPALKGMGTTACILLLQEDKAYIAHVGDSRIYLYLGKEKQLHRITKDHSFVQTLVDLPKGHPDKISDDTAENHPDKNRILKALGIKQVMEPTICTNPILPKNGDIFLICSDGLNGMLPDNKIESVLRKKTTLKEKGDRLIALALEAGGYDNITLQLIKMANCPKKRKKSVFVSYNPKGRPQYPGFDFGKLKKVMIWATIFLLMVALGGWYRWGEDKEHELKKNIEYQINVIAEKQKEHNTTLEALKEVKADIKKLKSDAGVSEERIKVKESELERFQNNVEKAKKNYEDAQNKLDALEAKLKNFQSKRIKYKLLKFIKK